ncbi:probable protein phosphatase 2C 1 [Aristolochia californica]|uniref:probable protein phosphatase 2C 1 n=1 Tax=Aristolochia californica TaxID=171875 RepID=UPI0035D6EA5B
MGSCISVGSINSDDSDGGRTSSTRQFRLCGFRRTNRLFSNEQVISFQHLTRVPNRVLTNGQSRTSCIFTQQGRKGINQDAMLVWEDYVAEDSIFCGVFDGHGPHGHLVARKVRDALPLKLLLSLRSGNSRVNKEVTNCLKKKVDMESRESVASAKDSISDDPLLQMWRNVFLKSFKAMDKELRSHPAVDCFCSGSTAVTLIKQGSNLFIGNIGDSRAVLGSRGNGDSMVAVQLTVDLKPDLPREAERIKKCKGRVFALQDEPEVQRVWLPFDDAPGLAMARAFGDFCLKDYGVISIPEFSHRVLTEKDQFVVLASDGVWDVLSNEQVVEIVSMVPSRSSAARVLVDAAVQEWKLKYPTSKIDDCAVICMYLDGKMDSESDTEEPLNVFAATDHIYQCQSQAKELEDGNCDELNLEPYLQRNFTVRSASDSSDHHQNRRAPLVVSAEEDAVLRNEDQQWSGLEGVTRVNSLVQLPRFSEERPKA